MKRSVADARKEPWYEDEGTGEYEHLLERCLGLEPIATAVAHPCDEPTLAGVAEASRRGLIVPILVGPAARIAEVADEAGVDLDGMRIVDVPHSHAAAARAVALILEGEAELLMKGSLHTEEFLSAVLSRGSCEPRAASATSTCWTRPRTTRA